MKVTKDYDIIFEKLMNKELEALYKGLIQFFNANDGLSNTHNLALFITKLNFKTEELKALKPYDYWHPFDDFIQELIISFPYKQHEEKYKSLPIENYFKYDFLELKNKFNNQIYPYHFNKKQFNAKPIKILEVMASYFAIKDFNLKANSIKVLDRDRPEKVAARIEKSKGVISTEKINQSENISSIIAQQALMIHYLFACIPLDENVYGMKAAKSKIVQFLISKNIDSIKDVLENHLGFKTPKSILEDIEIISYFLLKLQNKKIQDLISKDIKFLKSEIHK